MPKLKNSICVYGPPGCGKTTNGDRMRKALGLDLVVEADDMFCRPPSKRKIPESGALLLCVLPPEGIPVRTMTYKEAMRAVEKAGL